tara:strand:- start:344 stop:559 length:216 start_codon:yes stop_codon:yes gene_type:complete
MNNLFYKEGDLVSARKKDGHDSLHYQWITGFELPFEQGMITKVDDKKYYIKFIDGSEDCVNENEIELIAGM